ncbi:PorV/PorQ family protein [bacterium]|nr:PorV/PorQ family protein [bacterium]
MRKRIFNSCLIPLIAGLLFACQANAYDESAGAIFLNEPVGTRPAAMGEAFVGVSGDMNSIFWNSAGLIHSPNIELLFVHTEFIQDFRNEYLAFGIPFTKEDAIGVNFYFSYNNTFEKIASLNDEPSTFSAYDAYFGVSWSHAWDQYISSGLNVKGIYQVIDVYSARSIAADLCGLVKDLLLPDLTFGVVIKNLGLPIKFIAQADPLPITIEFGSSYKLFNQQLLLAFDISKPLQQEMLFKIGAEFNIEEVLFFRTGYKYYQYGNDLGALSGLTAGLGAEITDYKLDYTFSPYTDLGNIHRISVTFPFGRSTKEEEKIVRRLEKKLEEKQRRLIQNNIRSGDHHLNKREYQKAVFAYEKALALNPGYRGLDKKLKKAKQELQMLLAEKHYKAGLAAMRKKKYVNALIDFNKVMEIDKKYKATNKYLKQINKQLTAVKATRSSNRKEQIINNLFSQGLKYLQTRKYRKAIETWQKVLAVDSQNKRAKRYISATKIKLTEETDKLLQEASIDLRENDLASALLTWKKVLLIDNKNQIARQKIKENKNQLLKIADSLYKKGLQNYIQNQLEEAIKNWKDALILNPDDEKSKKHITRAREKIKGIKSLEK